MKILVINPNSDIQTDEILTRKAQALQLGIQVDVVHVNAAPKLVSTIQDVAKALPEMMHYVKETDYDAYVVACHSDPNLDVLKEITNKPVVGIAEASMKFASMYCNGFAVISPSLSSIPKKWTLAYKYHCLDLYRGYVVSQGNDEVSLCKAAREAIEQYYVDGIVLGCANYALADQYIYKQLNVPVFEGLACALILAKGLVEYQKYID